MMRLDLPHGIGKFLGSVLVVFAVRANAHDLAVNAVDGRQLATRATAGDALQRGLHVCRLLLDAHLVSFLVLRKEEKRVAFPHALTFIMEGDA